MGGGEREKRTVNEVEIPRLAKKEEPFLVGKCGPQDLSKVGTICRFIFTRVLQGQDRREEGRRVSVCHGARGRGGGLPAGIKKVAGGFFDEALEV